MSKEELLTRLQQAQACNGDPEAAHGMADDALLAYINDDEIRDAYIAVEKWYA